MMIGHKLCIKPKLNIILARTQIIIIFILANIQIRYEINKIFIILLISIIFSYKYTNTHVKIDVVSKF